MAQRKPSGYKLQRYPEATQLQCVFRGIQKLVCFGPWLNTAEKTGNSKILLFPVFSIVFSHGRLFCIVDKETMASMWLLG